MTASELERSGPASAAAIVDEFAPGSTRLRTQLVRFALSGGLSAVVDFGLLLALLHVGLPFVAAKTVSFIAGTSTAYVINRRWTFQAPPSRARFLAVAALYSAMFAVQVGISTGLHAVLPPGVAWVLLAFVIAQGTATTVNFVVQRWVIFRLPSRRPWRGRTG